MKVQNVSTINYKKQQNFGALKVKPKDYKRVMRSSNFRDLLNDYGLDGFTGYETGKLSVIIPTRKGSFIEKIIKPYIGRGAESISSKEARELVKHSLVERLGYSRKKADEWLSRNFVCQS